MNNKSKFKGQMTEWTNDSLALKPELNWIIYRLKVIKFKICT